MFNQYLKHSRTTILFVMMLGAFIIMSIFLRKIFNFKYFQSIASQIPEFGLLAIAIMLAMLTGGIDLSIISTANLAGVGAALILIKQPSPPVMKNHISFLAIVSAIGISLLAV